MNAKAEVLGPLERVLAWLLGLRDARDRIVCPAHRIEHTGKSACAAILACELGLALGRDDLVEAAIGQGRRLVSNLVREGNSACHTFRPGRHDPYNCSNAVIDGGACSDALAHLCTRLGERLGAEDRAAFKAASLLHARTYLRYAVLDKGIPAQRAWGMTGLAGAFALEADETLERALIEAVGMLEGIQHGDGSYPYHPSAWGAEHAGAGDVSAFYQSRVTGFLIFALERAGRDPLGETFRAPLSRGLTFLNALVGPDGRKPGAVEAKPWYWGAEYEVASHPFDVYALARGYALFAHPGYGRAAAAAFRAWVGHLDEKGAPRSHLPGPGRGPSYQCPLFWASHACWIARALEELSRCLALPPAQSGSDTASSIDLALTWFPDAQLARLEDGAVVAWVRGARPASNVHHGGPRGAGLLRVLRKKDGTDLVLRAPRGAADEAEWVGTAGLPAPLYGWRSGGAELRFSLWLARVHLRAGSARRALLAPFDVLRRGVLAAAAPRVKSSEDLSPRVELESDGVRVLGRLCHPGGRPAAKSAVERRFRIDGQGLIVEELLVDPGRARGVRYVVPRAATDTRREAGRVSFRLS